MSWPLVQIEDIGETGSGTTPPRDRADRYYGGVLPWVKSGELREDVVTQTEETVTALALTETPLKLVPRGAILVAMYGATVGRVAELGIEATTNQAVCHIVPDQRRLSSRYLFYAMRNAVPTLIAARVGGAQPDINQQIIKRTRIPLPPLADQRRIAAILDAADALRQKRRQALRLLDQLTQAIFVEMFGDPATNPKGWPTAELGTLIVDGPQNGLYKPARAYGAGTKILRIDAFYDGRVTKLAELKRLAISDEEQQTYGLREGDIVINRVNSIEYLGKSAIIPKLDEPVVFESNMMRFRVDETRVLSGYIIVYLQTPHVKAQIRTSTKDAVNQSSINQTDVRSFTVRVPPLKLQERFVAACRKATSLSGSMEEGGEHLDALFASLQYRAFRGEL